MLGTTLASPLLTFEATAFCCFSSSGFLDLALFVASNICLLDFKYEDGQVSLSPDRHLQRGCIIYKISCLLTLDVSHSLNISNVVYIQPFFHARALFFVTHLKQTDLSTLTPDVALLTQNSSHIATKRLHKLICSSRNWKLCAVDQTHVVLLEDDENEWEQSKHLLSTLNFMEGEADVMLKKAFGWVHSPYWGEERKKEVPKNDLVNDMLDYLKSLSLSDDDLHKLLKKFPEVLGCNLDEEVKSNISTLEREWGIKGKPLRNLLLRNPKVLGYNVDCKGDCMAQCTRCWVRF